MSHVMYIASDSPLDERPNPHDRMVSVNEALNLGVKVRDFMLEDGFNKERPVILVSDREVNINVDSGKIDDGGFDDDFGIFPIQKTVEMKTDRKYCAEFEILRYTTGRAEQFIEYLKKQLARSEEIELWNAWLGEPYDQITEKTAINADDLTDEFIAEYMNKDVAQGAIKNYCYVITQSERI